MTVLRFAVIGLVLGVGSFAHAGDANLDPGFGSFGVAQTPVGGAGDVVNALVQQADGKLVAAGTAYQLPGSQIALARYDADGSLDPTFGAGGTVLTAIGTDEGAGFALVQQPDGKFVTVASMATGEQQVAFAQVAFAVVRYDASGVLDPGFGSGGVVTTSFLGASDVPYALVQQPDGKLVAAGRALDGAPEHPAVFALARYHPDGTLDATFGTGGKVITPVGGCWVRPASLILQADGNLVVAGACFPTQGASGVSQFVLARHRADGSVDASFGTGGIVVTDVGGAGSAAVAQVIQQPDGKLVAVGYGGFGVPGVVLARYRTDGSLDPTFGSGGLAKKGFTGIALPAGVVQRADGSFVVGGVRELGPSVNYPASNRRVFTLVAFDAGGAVDGTFGAGGVATADLGPGYAAVGALLAQADGKFVLGGAQLAPVEVYDKNAGDFVLLRFGGTCGNGVVEGPEQCDDGNADGDDCCGIGCRAAPAARPCQDSDGDLCTEGRCDGAGACQGTFPVDCGACYTGCDPTLGCVAAPQAGCKRPVAALASSLQLRTDRLQWKWKRGEAISSAELGDPERTDYTLCVYDGPQTTLTLRSMVPKGGLCRGGQSCWSAKSGGQVVYSDPGGRRSAITQMTLAPGPSGVASILVKGSGSGLGVPARALDLPVRVQLQSENGGCWEASYDAGVSRNGAGTFKARGH